MALEAHSQDLEVSVLAHAMYLLQPDRLPEAGLSGPQLCDPFQIISVCEV